MNKIKKGDVVIVIAGKDKGKTGKVEVVQNDNYLMVEGVNLVKKTVKANPNANEPGGIVNKTMPIHRSNVMNYNENTKKAGKVGIRVLKDGRRVRYFKGTDQLLEAKE